MSWAPALGKRARLPIGAGAAGEAPGRIPVLRGIERRQARWIFASLVFVLALSFGTHATAGGDPDLEWWTIETEHTRIHHPRYLGDVAESVARAIEHLHAPLVQTMGYAPRVRTEIVLTDQTEFANGLATAVPFNTIRLYVTGPGDLTPLSDYDDWYLDLVSHEYTHVLHTDNISGVPALINTVIGKTLVPNQVQPRWILEGMAILSETTYSTAGRLRASLWEAMIRADVLDDNFAGIDQISAPARRWPQGTLWYLYGSFFLDYIARTYGQDALRAMAVDQGSALLPWGVNRAIRRTTGRTFVQLYEGFETMMRERVAQQMREVERRGLREGRRLTYHGRNDTYPTYLPAAARTGEGRYQLLYLRGDFDQPAGLYRIAIDDGSGKALRAEDLVARSAADSPASVAPDGTIAFAGIVPWKNVYDRSDLFLLEPGARSEEGDEPERRRLTVGMRASAPTLSPTGRHVAFTVNHAGSTTLQLAELDADAHLHGRRVLVKQERFEQAYTPAFSPDGRRVAYSVWRKGGSRDIWIVDVASGAVTRVTEDRAFDAGPCWSPDGSKLYFSSDRTGIFNIYELDVTAGSLRQVTNVRTGAFMPAVSEDGRLLAYVGYTSKGYDLYLMPLDPARFLEALPSTREAGRHEALGSPPVPFERYPYNPWPTLRPNRYFFSYAPGSFGGNALTMNVTSSDVVGHNSIVADLTIDPKAELPQLALTYGYGRLPFDLTVQLYNRLAPRTDYRINDARPEYVERSFGVRSAISYDHRGEFVSQGIGLSYTAAYVDGALPVQTVGPLDPYASPTVNPFQGVMSTVHLGYSLSSIEGSFDVAGGTRRGVILNLGLDVADDALGSTESLYAATYRLRGYIPMPWPGNHVLAVASSGGMSAGSYARRSLYYVGGYDFESTNLLDVITSQTLQGAFPLRGYPASSYSGSVYVLQNLEYRFPIAEVDHGISTLPFYLRRLLGNLYLDFGGAFNDFDFEQLAALTQGALLYSPQLHTSVGAEIWLAATLGYALDMEARIGYSYGFSAGAEDGGLPYFVLASTF